MRSRPPSREQPQLEPAIAEVLRTCVHPTSLLLRVERVVKEHLQHDQEDDSSDSGFEHDDNPKEPKTARRVILSDGQLMIQAVIHRRLHGLIDLDRILPGVLIDLRKFKVRRAARANGNGQVIYFGIEDLEVIGGTTIRPDEEQVEADLEGGFIRDDVEDSSLPSFNKRKRAEDTLSRENLIHPEVEGMPFIPSSPEADDFETRFVDAAVVAKRRQELYELKNNRGNPERAETAPALSKQQRVQAETKPLTPSTADATALDQRHNPGQSIAPLATGSPPISHPSPPLHELAYILNPPTPLPSRHYSCSIFATITWVSNTIIHKPDSPFPPKRNIKVHDPSLSPPRAGILIAVFVDARRFLPTVGTVALFRGLTMQRWQGQVILNAYSTLKDGESKWYVDNPDELYGLGHDVAGMRLWWEKQKESWKH